MRYRAVLLFSFFFFFIPSAFSTEAFHVLKNGETLYSISRKYNISLNLLLESNNIKDASRVVAGAKIYIPSSYVVKDGDTIYGIARRLNVSAGDLMSINSLSEKSLIKPGDILSVPKSTTIAKTGGKSSKYSLVPPKEDDYKPLDDPRNYSEREANYSLLWPVPAKKTFYLEGKLKGIVIESNKGEDVKSITSGKVISTGVHRGFGQVVFVQSKSKHIYVYGGLDKITVKPNQELSLNESIGKIGEEAFSGNARLYFIVYEKNQAIDPANAPRGF
ncbi:MAG: LysM peptidoglycan-binding domain-containing protein [Treponema sp.]